MLVNSLGLREITWCQQERGSDALNVNNELACKGVTLARKCLGDTADYKSAPLTGWRPEQ